MSGGLPRAECGYNRTRHSLLAKVLAQAYAETAATDLIVLLYQSRQQFLAKEKVCGCASTEATNPVFRSLTQKGPVPITKPANLAGFCVFWREYRQGY